MRLSSIHYFDELKSFCNTTEAAAFAQVLRHEGMLKTVQGQVRFVRARFGHYDLIDFVAVLLGYILSGEPTLLAFYEGSVRTENTEKLTKCMECPPLTH